MSQRKLSGNADNQIQADRQDNIDADRHQYRQIHVVDPPADQKRDQAVAVARNQKQPAGILFLFNRFFMRLHLFLYVLPSSPAGLTTRMMIRMT